MTASETLSLPASINCVLARRDPARLALDLVSAQADMLELVQAVGDTRTYLNGNRNAQAHRQATATARRLLSISRRLYTGRCARIRGHERLGRFVSAHEREFLDDGGLAVAGRTVAQLGRVLSKHGPRPASIRVRDSGTSGTATRLSEVGDSLYAALSTVVLDLTAADLSGLPPHEVSLLHNVLWASGTTWPPAGAERIRARSRAEVCPGVFLI
ncbi:hypothetical protein ABT063_07000 [Streptomyces sp. NPDC002838]|uniref:hypothetical protein n=1 Tax=Streptomyces sp. NPDC002838 TaxID=3154436 RepID=UPI0033185375